MAFSHRQGIATSINNWFTLFENFITVECGWTVVAGSGTQNLVLSSAGEGGTYTMLFANVWKDLGNPTYVLAEVQDDAAGTHRTTSAATGFYVDGGSEQFWYFMSGDKDSFVFSFKRGGLYRTMYVGIIEPYAAAPPDETYHMIVSNGVNQARILRNQAGLWDQVSNLQVCAEVQTAIKQRFDLCVPLGGLYFNTGANIAGQCKHISGELQALGVAAEDTLTSVLTGGTSEWIVLNDQSNRNFAMRTGGVLPAGFTDGAHLAFTAGIAPNWAAYDLAMATFLTGVGWNVTGGAGIRTARSFGESGLDHIRIVLETDAAGGTAGTGIWAQSWDGAHETAHYRNTPWPPSLGQHNYYFLADLDFIMIVQTNIVTQRELPIFAGRFPMAQRFLAHSAYEIIAGCGPFGLGNANCSTLYGLDGNWNSAANLRRETQGAGNSSPNAYDGATYIVFPYYAYIPGAEWLGVVKYIHHVQSAVIARHDTITIGARVYHVFQDATMGFYAVRTA